jgi:hypothetical protein
MSLNTLLKTGEGIFFLPEKIAIKLEKKGNYEYATNHSPCSKSLFVVGRSCSANGLHQITINLDRASSF